VAEELFLNTMTTGAGNDIEQASDLSRKMVCEFGMSSLGPITFGKKEEQIFLGREISQHRDFSEETAMKIDGEVRRFVDDGYNSARSILEGNRPILEKIAQALLVREVIDGNDIQLLIEGKELPIKVNPNAPPPAKDDVQQVLKPAPGQQPNVAPERPAQA
jgi:cell division protease FtsH